MDDRKELTLVRVFNASRDLVFKAWTEPELIAQWWGPRGVTNPVCEFDPQIGGNIYIVMVAGEELGDLKDSRWAMKGTIKEIKAPDSLIFTSCAIEEESDSSILESLVSVNFESFEEKTKVNVHIVVTKVTEKAEGPLEGMEEGWNQTLDKLSEWIANR